MNRNLIITSVLLITTVISSAVALNRQNQHQRLQDQVAQYRRQAEQLLAQVETDTRARLVTERQLQDAQSRLLSVDTKATAQARELVEARQKTDPDYEVVERQLRERITAELRRETQHSVLPTTASLISDLSHLPLDERNAVMAVQAQYGEFLGSIDADTQRREQIAQALVNIALDQNQARMDLVAQNLEPREMRQQLMALSSPDSVQDALSFALTEEEMALFEIFQQNQPRVFFNTIRGSGPEDGGRLPMRQGGSFIQAPDASMQIRSFDVDAPGQRIIIREAEPAAASPP